MDYRYSFTFLPFQELLESATLTNQEVGNKIISSPNGGAAEHGGNNKHRAHSTGRSKYVVLMHLNGDGSALVGQLNWHRLSAQSYFALPLPDLICPVTHLFFPPSTQFPLSANPCMIRPSAVSFHCRLICRAGYMLLLTSVSLHAPVLSPYPPGKHILFLECLLQQHNVPSRLGCCH